MAVDRTSFLDGLIDRFRKQDDPFLTSVEIEELSGLSIQSLTQQSTLVDIEPPINVCGDIHGRFYSLRNLLNGVGWPPKVRYLFLGDYVDRGHRSVEVICLLLALKCRYPMEFFLLRGNHEDPPMSTSPAYAGFRDECVQKYTLETWRTLSEVFAYLPLCALVGGRIMCIHGGISPTLKSFDTIRRIHRPVYTIPDQGIMCDLLWADPSDKLDDWSRNDERDISFIFGEDALAEFCQKFDIDLVIRGHEDIEEVVKVFGEAHQLITVHTCPNDEQRRRRVMGMIFSIMTLADTVRATIASLNEGMKNRKLHLANSKEVEKELAKVGTKHAPVRDFKLQYHKNSELKHTIQITVGNGNGPPTMREIFPKLGDSMAMSSYLSSMMQTSSG